MHNNIDLSIIIPVYGTEKYIRKCLESILPNVPERTEVIIINDGTKDNSEEIILEFKEKYSDIVTYYKKENGGLSHTKNYGLERANGKYITFVDSDDYVSTKMHKDMLSQALENDADIVYCDVDEVFESDGHVMRVNCTNPARETDFFKALDTPLMAASWNKIAKRELFDGIDYPVGLNNEDVAVTPILFGRAKKIIKINKAYYKYLQRNGSIQNSGFSNKRFVIFKTANICFDRAKELSEEKQEQIKGIIYTHQILALLLYPIDEVHDENRIPLITEFCELMNKEGDSFYNNKYVQEYVKMLKVAPILNLIKESKIDEISNKIEYYNKRNARIVKRRNTILRPFRSIKRRIKEARIRAYEKRHGIEPTIIGQDD